MANEKGVWRTIGGRRVFIKDGWDLPTAMKKSGKFPNHNKDDEKNIELLHCDDITEEILKEKKDSTIEPVFIKELYIFNDNNEIIMIYNEDNATFRKKNPMLDESKSISRIRERLGWDLQRLREVEKPEKVRTPDIKRIINKNEFEYWDIKNIGKAENKKSESKKIARAFEEGIGQSKNLVIDINKKECTLTNDESIKQIDEAFLNKRYKSIEKVVFLGKNNEIKVYKRKKN